MNTALEIKPLHDRVLVRDMPESRADGLVIIRECPEMKDHLKDDTSGEHTDVRRVGIQGVVVAVGPGALDDKCKFHPTTVKPGQVVMYSAWDDLHGLVPGHRIIREGDIWGQSNA